MRHLLVFAGLLTAAAGGFWWWVTEPTRSAIRTASFQEAAMPERAVVGPIALCAVGAFLLLLGVILHAGHPAKPGQ